MRQGYAAAESMILFVAVLIVTIISRAIMNKMEAEK
jgi:ABC-type sugar transport system permease subunit